MYQFQSSISTSSFSLEVGASIRSILRSIALKSFPRENPEDMNHLFRQDYASP